MATLQVRDIDSKLYNALRAKAESDHRSISQEVVHILEDHFSKTDINAISQTQLFLNLTNAWVGPESEDEIMNSIRRNRVRSNRFGAKNVTFD